jgi:hypothetical protein
MTLDWEYLVAVECGDYPVPISSLHTVRLLALIARQRVDHLDTLAEDERNAGSEESGVDSLHLASEESDTEERTETRRERRRDSAVSLPKSLSTSLPLSVHIILFQLLVLNITPPERLMSTHLPDLVGQFYDSHESFPDIAEAELMDADDGDSLADPFSYDPHHRMDKDQQRSPYLSELAELLLFDPNNRRIVT